MNELIRTENLTKEFETRKGFTGITKIKALDNVNISLYPNEIVGIVGASGSGKSTLAKILVFLYKSTSGKIYFKDEDITKIHGKSLKKYRKEIQMVFQDPYASLDPYHSIEWHIKRPLLISHYSGNIDDRIDELMNMVKLTPPESYKNKFPHQVSGGQRQRVYIARVLALNPQILIADEPVSMLDVSLRIDVLDLLLKIKNELGIGIIYITHDLNTVSMVTDRIYVLHNGEVVEDGHTNTILTSPQDGYTKALIEAASDPYKRI